MFPLDKEKMIYGTSQEKRKHLLSILTRFLKEQVEDLIPSDEEFPEPQTTKRRANKRPRKKAGPTVRNQDAGRITKREVQDFMRIDVPLLSKRDYFEQAFGKLLDEDKQED